MKFSFLSLTIGCSSLLALGLSQSPSIAATVTVHFPRMPMSGDNFEYTHTVRRSTSNPLPDVGALQNLFQGPTRTEIANAPGLEKALPLLPSNACNGQPLPPGAINAGRFIIKRQIRGSNIAYKIRICKPYISGGVGSTAILQMAIEKTLRANLKYVSGVKKITKIDIAQPNNQCLGGSGATCWP